MLYKVISFIITNNKREECLALLSDGAPVGGVPGGAGGAGGGAAASGNPRKMLTRCIFVMRYCHIL